MGHLSISDIVMLSHHSFWAYLVMNDQNRDIDKLLRVFEENASICVTRSCMEVAMTVFVCLLLDLLFLS